MDPILNCLTSVCCPPEARAARLSSALMEYCGCDQHTADTVGAWLFQHFDLAPAGTLLPLVHAITRLAKQ